jgi:hypothetical protein
LRFVVLRADRFAVAARVGGLWAERRALVRRAILVDFGRLGFGRARIPFAIAPLLWLSR